MTYTALCTRIHVSNFQRTSSNVEALSRNPVPRALATTGALLDNVSVKSHWLHMMCQARGQPTADVRTVDPCAANHRAAGGVHRKVPGALSLAAAAMMALNGAIVMPAVAGSLIAGEYIDPSHPGCERSIDDDGVVHGADAELPLEPGAACSPGAETVAWQVSGEISEDAMSIVVNFGESQGTLLLPQQHAMISHSNSLKTPALHNPNGDCSLLRNGQASIPQLRQVTNHSLLVLLLLTFSVECMKAGHENPLSRADSCCCCCRNYAIPTPDKITKDKQGAVTGSWTGEGLELPSGLWTKKCVGWLCSCPLE